MPVFVLDAFTGIYGTMQPDVVWSMRSDAGRKSAGVDDGWLDRFLLSFPRDLPAMGEQWRVVSTQTRSAWEDAVNELLSLAMQERSGLPLRPVLLKLSPDGCTSWKRFTDRIAAEMNQEGFPPHLRGPWVKLRAYGARLALILHCLRWAYEPKKRKSGPLELVCSESMEGAAQLVQYFQSHARKVYAAIDADPRHREARRVLRWLANSVNTVKGSKIVSQRDLHAGVWGGSADVDKASDIIALLVRYGWLRPFLEEARKGPGRHPSPRYEIHPLVFQTPSQNSQNSQNCSREPGQDG
jgi:hypothetical protein